MWNPKIWFICTFIVAGAVACRVDDGDEDDLMEQHHSLALLAQNIVRYHQNGSIASDSDYYDLMMNHLIEMHGIWQQMGDVQVSGAHMMDGQQLENLIGGHMQMYRELENFKQTCVGPEMDGGSCHALRPAHLSLMNEILEEHIEICLSITDQFSEICKPTPEESLKICRTVNGRY